MTDASPGPITYLDGRRLQRLFHAGIERLIGERGYLDRINVFPVPDGDTGTNLALTFGAVAERLRDSTSRHAGELLAEAADAALEGARGNSGAIFAQYLQGLAGHLTDEARVTPHRLAEALAAADRCARNAIQQPVEGTVLTVMSAMAESIAPDRFGGDDYGAVFTALLDSARRAAASTRGTLEDLRIAGVEDAGALGMLALLEGMADALEPGRAPPRKAADTARDLPLRAQVDEAHRGPPDRRFCTECLVTGPAVDADALRRELAAIGSSVVVVGGRNKLRMHVHVDDPEAAFGLARRHGAVSARKADDMLRQERALRSGARVAVATDSGADLPDAVWDTFGIPMVPLRVSFGEESHLDKVGLDSAAFWTELARHPVPPTTSQPPPGDFRRVYERLSSHFDHIVSISLTGRLSGTHQAAVTAAARLGVPQQLTVIDSCNASVGQGLIVLAAAEAAVRGAGAEEVIAAARAAIASTRTYAFVPNLRQAVRGGRIPKAWRWVARALPVCFVVATQPDGGLRVRRVLPRGADPVRALLNVARADLRTSANLARAGSAAGTDAGTTPALLRVAIAHGDCAPFAERLKDGCAALAGPGARSPDDPPMVAALGPTFGAHGGAGTLVLAIQSQTAGASTKRSAVSPSH